MKSTAPIVALFLSVGLHVVSSADVTLTWKIQNYDDMTAQVGDTVTFDFTSGHNVFIHPSGTCDETGAIEVGTSGPVTYTFSETDAGTDIVFACDVGGHCENGQLVKFTVTADADEPTASPVGGGSTTTAEPTASRDGGYSPDGNQEDETSATSNTSFILASLSLLVPLFL